jgi:coenzyme PQQ biosynthesis protein PqqD
MVGRLEQRPRLSRAARLRFDSRTHGYVLLSPERGLRLNASATDIVRRCTGELTVRQMVQTLLAQTELKEATEVDIIEIEITADVLNLLWELDQRRLVVFETSP